MFSTVNRWRENPGGYSASIIAVRDEESVSCVLPVGQALGALGQIRPLLGNGLAAYVGYGIEDPSTYRHDELAVKALPGPSDIVRHMGTEAINYDLTNEDIALRIGKLLDQYPLDILGAGLDVCLLRCTGRTARATRLARTLDELCPDLVMQGLGTVRALVELVRRREVIRLWWD